MNKQKLILTAGSIAFSLMIVGILYAQQSSVKIEPDIPKAREGESHIQMAREIYKQMSKFNQEGICRMDFTITTVDQTFDTPDTTVVNVEYLASTNRIHYESEQLSLYQDQSVAVAIIPDRRTLFIAPSSLQAIREKQSGLFFALQDSLFENCSVLKSEALSHEGANRELTLSVGERMRKLYRIDRVKLLMNTESKKLQNIQVWLLPPSGIRFVEMNYKDVEWMQSTTEFQKPVLDRFFDPNGALRAEYRGYTISDKRKSITKK
ncbi:MAG: hypothetical protein J4G05_09915 [Chlorobi bacterium]|nr:hypothetical protein [Chlorobiota bacterium]